MLKKLSSKKKDRGSKKGGEPVSGAAVPYRYTLCSTARLLFNHVKLVWALMGRLNKGEKVSLSSWAVSKR